MCEAQRKQTGIKQTCPPCPTTTPGHSPAQETGGGIVCLQALRCQDRSLGGVAGAPTGQGSRAAQNLEVEEMLAMWIGGSRHRRTWGAAQAGGTRERRAAAPVPGRWAPETRECALCQPLFQEGCPAILLLLFSSSPLTDYRWISRGRDLTEFFTV